MEDRPRLLLHVCCGPCATAVIERLIERFDVTAFWHNPNVQPKEEHDKRLEYAQVVADEFDVDLIIGARNEDEWVHAVAGCEGEPEGGKRCGICFEFRLREVARQAAEMGFDYVATTLSVSPHKPAERINEIGHGLAEEVAVKFLGEDFKKQDGYRRSVELSKQLGLYRQRFCGCLYARSDDQS